MSPSDQARPKGSTRPITRAEPERPGTVAARWTAAQPWISLVARLGLGVMWLYYSVP